MYIILLILSTGNVNAKNRDWEIYPDFDELRNQIGWSDSYYESCQKDRPKNKVVELLNLEKWQEAADVGRIWLNNCPIDIGIHYYCGIAFDQLKNKKKAEIHYKWLDELMNSVMSKGNGKTPESAIVTVSISEEYDVLNIFRLKPLGQSLVNHERPLDAIKVKDEYDKEFTVYFYPEAHFDRLTNMFD